MDYGKKPLIENSRILHAGSYARSLAIKIKEDYGEGFDFSTEEGVKHFLDTTNKKGGIERTYQENKETKKEVHKLILTYTKSNLGRGFIFWFICDRCGKKAKYLYSPPYTCKFFCRNCHRLAYHKQNLNKDKELSKLLRNPDLIRAYSQSGNWKKKIKNYLNYCVILI